MNVQLAPAGTPLSSSYAAAGTAGSWNRVTGIAGNTFSLVDADGTATGITLTQSPTTTLLTGTDPSVHGDDATLLNNGLVTNGAETCLFFHGVQPGRYDVLIYAWLPGQPTVLSRTRQDEAPSTIDVGGAWTGAHAEGVTYARYSVDVGADGELPTHSGLAPNAPAAALNGVQFRLLGTGTTGNDAGMDPGGPGDPGGTTSPHSGGCTTGRSSGFAIVVLFVLVRRRRRAR